MRTDAEQLFIRHLPLIRQIVARLIRKHQVSSADAEDFISTVYLRLIDHDYRILREFQHRSSMATFLNVVIGRFYLDFRNQQWGKWRPSAAAKRQGQAAVLLEQLTDRDGFTLLEAIELVRARHDLAVPRQALVALADRLPARPARLTRDDDGAVEVPDPAPLPDAMVGAALAADRAGIVRRALDTALDALDARDRELIDRRFRAGRSVADIARTLQLDQRRLYRTFERVLDDLRRTLEADATIATLARALMHEGWSDVTAGASERVASKVA